MIRKATIIVLVLMTVGTAFLWISSYQNTVTISGQPFRGWCMDCRFGRDTGLHVIYRYGGICFSYSFTVPASRAPGRRSALLTENLGYQEYPYTNDYPCPLIVSHQLVERAGSQIVLRSVCFPLSLLFLLAAGYSVVAFLLGPIRRRRRRRKGLCLECGYDLTANVSGVCPECGGTIHDSPKISV